MYGNDPSIGKPHGPGGNERFSRIICIIRTNNSTKKNTAKILADTSLKMALNNHNKPYTNIVLSFSFFCDDVDDGDGAEDDDEDDAGDDYFSTSFFVYTTV